MVQKRTITLILGFYPEVHRGGFYPTNIINAIYVWNEACLNLQRVRRKKFNGIDHKMSNTQKKTGFLKTES